MQRHSSLIQESCAKILFRCLALLATTVLADCDNIKVFGGRSARWPTQNPLLVAPASIIYNYEVYHNPLQAEFTGDAISIFLPYDYSGGFRFKGTNGSSLNEEYKLVSIHLRRPAKPSGGTLQKLPHIFEAALVHQQVGTPYYAEVVVPFEINIDAHYDFIASFTGGAQLPSRFAEVKPILLSSSNALNVNSIWQADYQTYWTTLPTTCGTNAYSRLFVRNTTMPMWASTFHSLMQASDLAPVYPPVMPPTETWIVQACAQESSCGTLKAPTVTAALEAALVDQSMRVEELRERRALMDTNLRLLANHTPGSYNMAVSSRNDLKAAEDEFDSSVRQVNELEGFINQSQSAVFDSNAPWNKGNSSSMSTTNMTAASLLMSSVSVTSQDGVEQQLQDCNVLEKSPVDIDISRAIHASAISSTLSQDIFFQKPVRSQQAQPLRLNNNGHFLRISPVKDAQGKPNLGAIFSRGIAKDVSYIDLYIPGQHSVNGQSAAAELQFVHEGQGQDPSIAVAMMLELDERNENKWLAKVLSKMPMIEKESEVEAGELDALHSVLHKGSTGLYLRYDGTLMTPPCQSAEWYVLEEPGRLSPGQLEMLSTSLPLAQSPKRFSTSLVMIGTPTLIGQVTGRGFAHGARLTLRGCRAPTSP